MTCDDCAESENGQPAQACCPQCLEEQADALADHLELSGALSLLKQRDAMCVKLAEALKVARQSMINRKYCEYATIRKYSNYNSYDLAKWEKWTNEESAVEAVLAEWEAGKCMYHK